LNNYHTHTYRCGHATGEVIDYAREASKQGLQVLGISDHTPWPDGRWSDVRMTLEELPGYLKAIEEAQEKYPELTFLKALECEYIRDFHGFFQELKEDLDYLIGAVHFIRHRGEWLDVYGGVQTKDELATYTDQLLLAMDSGLFSFMAHPDLFANSYLRWDEEAIACSRTIIEAAVSYGIPLEINGYGWRKPTVDTPEGRRPMYPWRSFWELAVQYPVGVIINSDAHQPEDVGANLEQGRELAKELGLEIVEFLPVGERGC
jgi:histidinol-phosphatase (PHP family)